MREKLRYTATHAVQQEPIESARKSNSSRLLLYPVVPRSRTITRTIWDDSDFPACLRTIWRTGPWCSFNESLARTGQLVRCVGIVDRADVAFGQMHAPIMATIVTEVRGFLSSHENRLPRRRPGRFRSRGNQALHGDNRVALKCSIAQFWCSRAASPSDCLPDVPQQLSYSIEVTSDCPCSVRIFEVRQRAS